MFKNLPTHLSNRTLNLKYLLIIIKLILPTFKTVLLILNIFLSLLN